jgi:hypothetical protein
MISYIQMTDEAASVVTLKGWVLIARKPVLKRGVHFLMGMCWGHNRIPDGASIRTSRIVDVSGRYVATHSGTLYYLDDPGPEYIKFLQDHGYIYNPEEPIIVE